MKPQNSRPENCGGISFLDNNEKTRSTRYLKRLQTLLIVINVTENSKRCMQERCKKKPGRQIELRKKFYISTL